MEFKNPHPQGTPGYQNWQEGFGKGWSAATLTLAKIYVETRGAEEFYKAMQNFLPVSTKLGAELAKTP